MGRFLLACCAVVLVAGCSSSSHPTIGPIGAARTYELSGFQPRRVASPGPTAISFTIRQPSGAPLTDYRRGAGPHTGIHLIIVRRDLGVIIHHHPPVAANGRVSETVDLPTPGPYRVLVDAYPAAKGAPRNFQLHTDLRVGGAYRPQPVPPFAARQQVGGYTITLRKPKRIHPIEATTLTATVTDPSGKPVVFHPWFGALAHAIFFRQGSLDYFHTHVCAPGAAGCTSFLGGAKVTGSSTRPGRLTVGVLVPAPGTWRLFLQTKLGGRVVTAPFTLKVS